MKFPFQPQIRAWLAQLDEDMARKHAAKTAVPIKSEDEELTTAPWLSNLRFSFLNSIMLAVIFMLAVIWHFGSAPFRWFRKRSS